MNEDEKKTHETISKFEVSVSSEYDLQISGTRKRKKSGISHGPPQKKIKTKEMFDLSAEVLQKLYKDLKSQKNSFIVVNLQNRASLVSLPPTTDPDPLISSEITDDRCSFRQFAYERNLEFSSLRRAKFSTLLLLYKLHMERHYVCKACNEKMRTSWHCTVCCDFDLCRNCYSEGKHPHQMKQRYLYNDRLNAYKEGLRNSLSFIQHAHECKKEKCEVNGCKNFKKYLRDHWKYCIVKDVRCWQCSALLEVLKDHARGCKNDQCQILLCTFLKKKLRQRAVEIARKRNIFDRWRSNSLPTATDTGCANALQQPNEKSSTPCNNVSQFCFVSTSNYPVHRWTANVDALERLHSGVYATKASKLDNPEHVKLNFDKYRRGAGYIAMILHAINCPSEKNNSQPCYLVKYPQAKDALDHIKICENKGQCNYEPCEWFKHWNDCKSRKCLLCQMAIQIARKCLSSSGEWVANPPPSTSSQ